MNISVEQRIELGFEKIIYPFSKNANKEWYLKKYDIWWFNDEDKISHNANEFSLLSKKCESIEDIKFFIEFVKFMYYPNQHDEKQIQELLDKKNLRWISNKLERMSERYMEAEAKLLVIVESISWWNIGDIKSMINRFLESRTTKYKF